MTAQNSIDESFDGIGGGMMFEETENGYSFTFDAPQYLTPGVFSASASVDNGTVKVELSSVEEDNE